MNKKLGATLLAGIAVSSALSGFFAPAAAAAPVTSNAVATNQATFTNAINENGNGKVSSVDWFKYNRYYVGKVGWICWESRIPSPDNAVPPNWRDWPNPGPYTPGSIRVNCGTIPPGAFSRP